MKTNCVLKMNSRFLTATVTNESVGHFALGLNTTDCLGQIDNMVR